MPYSNQATTQDEFDLLHALDLQIELLSLLRAMNKKLDDLVAIVDPSSTLEPVVDANSLIPQTDACDHTS